MTTQETQLDVEQVVQQRYSAAAGQKEAALCCPVQYDSRYLEALPRELIDRDYGCGDPSRYVATGESVLDLGSGGGKVCYIAAQIVGPTGRVVGVDMNEDMLALARKYRKSIGDRLGFHNVQFHKGRIQDLALDLDRFEQYLQAHPVGGSDDWFRTQAYVDELRSSEPMIGSDSIDVIVSNCVLNLVAPPARRQLFSEMFRVLKQGGRAVISDIVSDRPVPDELRRDPTLWSGCMGGAFVEAGLLDAMSQAGFLCPEIIQRAAEPWATIEDIAFRSVTVRTYKGVVPGGMSLPVADCCGPEKCC